MPLHAGKLLLQVKERLPHRRFQVWVEENLTCSCRKARTYMQIAKMAGSSQFDPPTPWPVFKAAEELLRDQCAEGSANRARRKRGMSQGSGGISSVLRIANTDTPWRIGR